MTDSNAEFDRRRGVGERTALYRLYDAQDALLYIGITKNTGQRWHQHSQTKSWWRQVVRREVEWLDDRPDALLAESRAILTERPLHNPPNPSHQPGPRTKLDHNDPFVGELRATQAAVQKAAKTAQAARTRRQEAVLAARAADWSKYRIAAVLGVKAPTVDSIIKAAEKEETPDA